MIIFLEEVWATDPFQLSAKALTPGIFALLPPVRAPHHSVVHLQHSTDLSWKRYDRKEQSQLQSVTHNAASKQFLHLRQIFF